jgi:hypothetical protein
MTSARAVTRSSAVIVREAGHRLSAQRVALIAAVVLVLLSVPRFSPPTYALEWFYTDHLQHEYSAWAFLHIGPRIFALPKTDWGNVHAAHVHLLWDSLPTIYPPGLVLFFMPFAVASNEGLLSDLHVHMLEVMTLGTAGVLASFQLRRTLKLTYDPALAAILTFFGTILFVRWGLDGFIDSLAALLALTGIYWMRRDMPGRAVLVMAAGLSLQYRMWYLWPLVIALAIERRHEIRRWQLACTYLVGFISAMTFGLSEAYAANFRENPGIGPNALSVAHGVSLEQGLALTAGLIVVGITYFFDSRTAAACVALAFGLLFFVDQWEPWYPVVLFPLFAVVRTRPAQIVLTLAFLQVFIHLGGFPDVLQTLHLYIDAVR